MTKGIVECYYCSEKRFYDGECPNDIIEQTGFVQDSYGNWTCPDCYTDKEVESGD